MVDVLGLGYGIDDRWWRWWRWLGKDVVIGFLSLGR